MSYCPNCGALVEDDKFCHECGTRMDGSSLNSQPNPIMQSNADSHHEKIRKYTLIGIGYFTVVILLGSVFYAYGSVRLVNEDRLILYPLLSVMLSIYVSLKLINDNRTFIHGVIVAVLSALIFLWALLL